MNILFIILILIIGYLTNLPQKSRFGIAKAFGLVVAEVIISITVFIILIVSSAYLNILPILLNGTSSIFTSILVLAILGAIVVYWGQVTIYKKWPVNPQVLTLQEYIIQWALIYMTVYQVIFDNLFTEESFTQLASLELVQPSEMMVLILPALISVWIAVILYKVRQKQL